MPSPIRKQFQFGAHTVTIETGEIARQASGAVMVDMDGTSVLVTVVGSRSADAGRDFFPLTVDYQERTYAAGRIPGAFKMFGRWRYRHVDLVRMSTQPVVGLRSGATR